jgi:hypothetical protein
LKWKAGDEIKTLRYSEVRQQALELGSGLTELSSSIGKRDEKMVGIYSKNRAEVRPFL